MIVKMARFLIICIAVMSRPAVGQEYSVSSDSYNDWRASVTQVESNQEMWRECVATTGGDGEPTLKIRARQYDAGPPDIYPQVEFRVQAPRNYNTLMQAGATATFTFDDGQTFHAIVETGTIEGAFKFAVARPVPEMSLAVLQSMRRGMRLDIVYEGALFYSASLNGFTAAYGKIADACEFSTVGVIAPLPEDIDLDDSLVVGTLGTGTSEPADNSPPGKFGEPYAESAIFQGCLTENQLTCSFYASGFQIFVNEDWRTPSFVFDLMQKLSPGTPIFVEGDLIELYDRTADMVLRNVTTVPWTTNDTILHTMQGTWYSTEDPSARVNILGAEMENSYDDVWINRDYLTVSDWCDTFHGGGTYLRTIDEETGETSCYSIERITDLHLDLRYLPRGNILSYRSLD